MDWAIYFGIGVCVLPFVKPDDGWSFGSGAVVIALWPLALFGALTRPFR